MNPRHAIAPAYLGACILLGGASAAGFLSNLLLQLVAIVLLVLAFVTRRQTPVSASGMRLLTLLGLLVCLFAAQLVPLPPALWTGLPGRSNIAESFALLGLPLPWLPVSLAPLRTIYSLLWLLPAFAVTLAIVRMGAFRSSWTGWVITGGTVLSVGVGAMQVAAGQRSPMYFYDVTNRGLAVGFFSNNNHMATLLLICIPFVGALMSAAFSKSRRAARRSSGLLVLTITVLLIVAVGLAINTSLAGIGLAIPVAAATFAIVRWRNKPAPRWLLPLIAALALGGVAAVFSSPMGNNLTSDEARTTADSRYTSFSKTLTASQDYFPVGSGVGTFVSIYRTQEDPREVTNVFMNHAHSDLLEILLETGLPGLLLLGLFLIWWVTRAATIWRAADPDVFARAATIASAAVILHSLVDYPLRTAAISALFAACLAFMAEPRPKVERRGEDEGSARHLSAD